MSQVNISEKQFTNVLLLRQVLGRGAINFFQDNIKGCRRECVARLTSLAHLLLPQSEVQHLEAAAQKIIDKAIELKRITMEAQALISWLWFQRGDEFKETEIKTFEEEPDNSVLICTFPGLARTIMDPDDNNKRSLVIISKAMVNTERAFDDYI
jgi:hypothetical protein